MVVLSTHLYQQKQSNEFLCNVSSLHEPYDKKHRIPPTTYLLSSNEGLLLVRVVGLVEFGGAFDTFGFFSIHIILSCFIVFPYKRGKEVPAEAILCLVLIHCVKPTYETPKKAHITSTQITPLRCHKEGGGDFYTERKPNCKKDPTAMTCSTIQASFSLGH